MKKESKIVLKENRYKVIVILNNIALVECEGKKCLVNIKSMEIINDSYNYNVIYNTKGNFFKLIIKDKDQEYISIYDTVNERFLVEEWEVFKNFSNRYDLLIVRNNGKKYLINTNNFDSSLFNMPLDNIELLSANSNKDMCFILTKEGKKGLYYISDGNNRQEIIKKIKYNYITKIDNLIICNRKKKKAILFFDDNGIDGVDLEFDDIFIDKNNSNIVYGKKDNLVYVYDTKAKMLVMVTSNCELELLNFVGINYNHTLNGKYLFKIKKDHSYNILDVSVNNSNIEQRLLLNNNYDDIIAAGKKQYKLISNNKMGYIILDNFQEKMTPNIEVVYDKIESLGNSLYALYNKDQIEIGKIDDEGNYNSLIVNCSDLILVGLDTYIFVKDGLKGLIHLGAFAFNNKYKDILVGSKDEIYTYIAVKEKDHYELYRRENNVNLINERFIIRPLNMVKFLNKVFVVKDNESTCIYNYNGMLIYKNNGNINVKEYEDGLIINDAYYNIVNNVLVECLTEQIKYYVTTYENEEDIYEVSCKYESILEQYCKLIDSMDDAAAINKLNNDIENANNLGKFSRVRFKKQKKINKI